METTLQVMLLRDFPRDLNMMKCGADCASLRSCQCVNSPSPPKSSSLCQNTLFDGITSCQNTIKPSHDSTNVIKIKNKSFNQLKEPSIIRFTIDVGPPDCVRNNYLDYFIKHHKPTSFITIHYVSFQRRIYYTVLEPFHLNVALTRK